MDDLPAHVVNFRQRQPAPDAPAAEKPEPERQVGEIKPPSEISKAARKWFKYYVDQADGQRRYVQADAQGLAMLAEATADYWRLTKELTKHSGEMDTKKRWTIASERSSREKLCERLLKEFGLTWKSRGNL